MLHYSMVIQWSKKDNCFIVTLPEWGNFCQTYGDTYEQALKNAKEVLQLMIDSSLKEEAPLPKANTFNETLREI